MHLNRMVPLALLALVAIARAEPLDPHQIPANVAWYIHVNLDAARESTAVQSLRSSFLNRPEVKSAVDRLRLATGVDPTREVRSFTIYGNKFEPEHLVILVRGKVNRPRLEKLLTNMREHHVDNVDGYQIHCWTDAQNGRPSTGAFVGADMIAISPDQHDLLAALQVIDGKRPSVSGEMAQAAPAGTILLASAAGLAEAKSVQIKSPIVRQCESGRFVVGEQAGEVFVQAQVTTSSPETASQIKALADGARAMGQLQSEERPQIAELCQAIKITLEQKTVSVQLRYSAEKLVRIIESEQARRPADAQQGRQP